MVLTTNHLQSRASHTEESVVSGGSDTSDGYQSQLLDLTLR